MTIAVALGLLLVLVVFLKKSQFGVQMRAAAEDFQMAQMLGVRANVVIGTALVISAFLAAIVSLLFLCQVGVVSFHMGTQLMLIAFIATVVGGMGSLAGAVVGGYTIGIFGTLLQVLLPDNVRTFRDAFVFAAVILVLFTPARPARNACCAGACVISRVFFFFPTPCHAHHSFFPALSYRACSDARSNSSLDRTVVEMLIRIVFVVGLYIFVGNSGVVSFGHAAFIMIGAYATAWQDCCSMVKPVFMPALPQFILDNTVPPPIATVTSGLFAALFGLVVGTAIMRLSGIAASIATFAMLAVVNVVYSNWDSLTSGTSTISGIPEFTDHWIGLVAAVAAIVVAYIYKISRFGLMFPPLAKMKWRLKRLG